MALGAGWVKMKDPKILVIYKESAYTRFKASQHLPPPLRKGRYWNVICGSHQRHSGTIQGIRDILSSEGIPATWVLRHKIHHLKDVDRKFKLIITVGGDGTLLDSSHITRKAHVMGVNSDPVRSVARFSACTLASFRTVLRDYLEGKIEAIPVPRLEFSINGKRSKWLILNDLLVSTLSPAGTSRYMIKVGNRIEEQMSSGIWISTAAGSTAAIASAGGEILPSTSKQFQYVVREAYPRKFGPRLMLKEVLNGKKTLEILSYMKDGRIFVDGASLTAPFGLGDRLKIGLSDHPLWIVGFKKKLAN
jgi:NAD+ kinase